MLMYKEDGGFRNVADHELDNAKSEGWIDGQSLWDDAIAKKKKPVAVVKQDEPATIQEQPVRRAGRPRKGLSSILGMTTDGDSADDNQ